MLDSRKVINLQGCRARLVSPIVSKIDLKGDPIFQSAAWFFVIILKFVFTSIFEKKIHEKKILDTKKISCPNPNWTHESISTA